MTIRRISSIVLLLLAAGVIWVLADRDEPVDRSVEQPISSLKSGNSVGSDQTGSTFTGVDPESYPDLLDATPVTTDSDEDLPEIEGASVQEFAQAYREAAAQHDLVSEYQILEQLYQTEQVDELLPYLAQHAFTLRRFVDAQQYLMQMHQLGQLSDPSYVHLLIRSLFNTLDLNLQNLTGLKELIRLYTERGVLSNDDRNYYLGLVAFAKGDLDNYSYFIDQLTGQYTTQKVAFDQIRETVYGYQDPPPTYLPGLITLDLYQQGYFRLVQIAAQRLIKQDPDYILPYQLDAYASLALQDRSRAERALNNVKLRDEDNEQLYTYLAGVTAYEQGAQASAITQFRQIDSLDLQQDAQRYLLLAYAAIDDVKQFDRTLEQLMKHDYLLPHDYFTVFSLVFFAPKQQQADFPLFRQAGRVVTRLLTRCFATEADYEHICMYGKAGLFLVNSDPERAYRHLQQIVHWYPQPAVFEQLMHFAVELERPEEAHKWFLRAMLLIDNQQVQQQLQANFDQLIGEE